MKTLLVAFAILLLTQFSHQKTEFRNCTDSDIEKLFKDKNKFDDACQQVTCLPSGNAFSALTCPPYRCPEGLEIGYKEDDNSKVYPECCGGPICDD